jgi:hypothetical protein
MNTEPTTQAAPGTVGRTGVVLATLDDIWRFAETVMASGMAPKGIANTAAAAVTIQMGMELGLPPMAALQNIAAVNGRPAIRGDAMLGVVRATGELEEFTEWHEDAGGKLARVPADFPDSVTAVCRVKRRGHEAVETSFSVADAKRAKLWGGKGPWTEYPARMLKFRARSFALRDEFGDALRGLRPAEEQQDIPEEIREAEGGTARPAKTRVVTAPEKTVRKPRGGGKSTATEHPIPPRDVMRSAIRAAIRTAKMTVQTAQVKYREAGLLADGKELTDTTDAELFHIYQRPDVLATASNEGGAR